MCRDLWNGPKKSNTQCTTDRSQDTADEIYVREPPAVVIFIRDLLRQLSTKAVYILDNLKEKLFKGADYFQIAYYWTWLKTNLTQTEEVKKGIFVMQGQEFIQKMTSLEHSLIGYGSVGVPQTSLDRFSDEIARSDPYVNINLWSRTPHCHRHSQAYPAPWERECRIVSNCLLQII